MAFKNSSGRRDFYFSRRAIRWLAEHRPDDLAWLRRVKGNDGDGENLIHFTPAVRKEMGKPTHDRIATLQDAYAEAVNNE